MFIGKKAVRGSTCLRSLRVAWWWRTTDCDSSLPPKSAPSPSIASSIPWSSRSWATARIVSSASGGYQTIRTVLGVRNGSRMPPWRRPVLWNPLSVVWKRLLTFEGLFEAILWRLFGPKHFLSTDLVLVNDSCISGHKFWIIRYADRQWSSSMILL